MQQASAINFSKLPRSFQAMIKALEDGIDQVENTNYPPHNIYRTGEDDFHIEIAIAGFTQDEIDISVEKSELKVSGTKAESDNAEDRTFLHKGIAMRDFRRSYRLGEYIIVRGAEMRDGVLTVHLSRELPEEAKARKIPIKTYN